MGTTAIFAEILIIGVQASVWYTLIILSIWGYAWLPSIVVGLNDWEVLITIIFLCHFLYFRYNGR